MYEIYISVQYMSPYMTYLPELRVLVLTKRHVGSGNEIGKINKLTSVFYASVLLLIMNFVITLSK